MRKAAVRHGDPTTTRGFVMAYSSTIHDDGKKVALSGDEATCGNCKGAYRIFGTGKGMGEKGRVVVLDGDRVLCPCGKNRVIVGSNPGIWITTSDGSAGASSAAAAISPLSVENGDDYLERYFEIVDAKTGTPVEGMTHKLLSNGHALAYDATLAGGKTRAFSLKDHPDLTFVAWIEGDVR